MTKKRSSEIFMEKTKMFRVKKVIQNFSLEMCSDEFFLKHDLSSSSTFLFFHLLLFVHVFLLNRFLIFLYL